MKRRATVVIAACLLSVCGVLRAAGRTPLPEPSLYAIYSWAGEFVQYYNDIKDAGFTWARCGGWRCGEAVTDKAVALAAADGLHLVPVLSLSGMGHGKTRPAEQAVAEFRKLVAENVRRYGPDGAFWCENPQLKANPIRYWEIWNEPNIEFLTPPEGMLRTELYARLLTAASQEIRRLDPDAKIVAFNTAGGNPDRGQALKADGMFQKLKYIGWRKFIRDVAALVPADSYDFIGTHPYTKPRGPEAGGILGGLAMIEELGLNKPVWFTEVGFPLDYPRNQQVPDERHQAAYLVRLFAIAAANGVVQVQVMYVTDIIYGPDQSKRTFGLFTEPGQWRQQATAAKVMSRLIPDPRKAVEKVQQDDGGIFTYAFTGVEGEKVFMSWNSTDEKALIMLPEAEGPWCVVDMLGRVKEITVADGGILSVPIGLAPVYIVQREANKVIESLK